MRIDKAGQNNFAGTVDLDNFLTILLQPGITQRIFGRANGNDLPAEAKDSSIPDDAEFSKVGTTARAGPVRRKLEREQLADVGEKQCRLLRHSASARRKSAA